MEHSSRSHLIRASHKATALMGPSLGRVFLEAPHASHCPERYPTVEVPCDSTHDGTISGAQRLPPPRAPLKARRQVQACVGTCKGLTHTTAPRVGEYVPTSPATLSCVKGNRPPSPFLSFQLLWHLNRPAEGSLTMNSASCRHRSSQTWVCHEVDPGKKNPRVNSTRHRQSRVEEGQVRIRGATVAPPERARTFETSRELSELAPPGRHRPPPPASPIAPHLRI